MCRAVPFGFGRVSSVKLTCQRITQHAVSRRNEGLCCCAFSSLVIDCTIKEAHADPCLHALHCINKIDVLTQHTGRHWQNEQEAVLFHPTVSVKLACQCSTQYSAGGTRGGAFSSLTIDCASKEARANPCLHVLHSINKIYVPMQHIARHWQEK